MGDLLTPAFSALYHTASYDASVRAIFAWCLLKALLKLDLGEFYL